MQARPAFQAVASFLILGTQANRSSESGHSLSGKGKLVFYFFVSETKSNNASQADLKLAILLSQLLKC